LNKCNFNIVSIYFICFNLITNIQRVINGSGELLRISCEKRKRGIGSLKKCFGGFMKKLLSVLALAALVFSAGCSPEKEEGCGCRKSATNEAT